MIARILIPLVAASALLSVARADDPANGDVVPMDARYLFAPVGFDDNDEAVVVLDGYLPSGCYRLTRPEVVLDQATREVRITPMARYFDIPCIEAMVPYSQEIKLGVLPEGQYELTVKDGLLKQRLDVVEATNAGPDDYLYAPVDTATVERDRVTGKYMATLEGRFTTSCLGWEEVKVIDTGATVAVLPVMALTDDGTCTPGEYPFKKVVELPESVTEGRHLLHVRSLNGQAVNHLFYKSPL